MHTEPSSKTPLPLKIPQTGETGGADVAPAVAQSNVGRWVTGLLIVVMVLAVWQASRLDLWALEGPGPGLIPLIAAVVGVITGLLALVAPGTPTAAAGEEGDDGPVEEAEQRSFRVYVVALIGLVVGVFIGGFIATTTVVTVFILRFGERRPWHTSISYAVAVALVGDIVFGRFLGVALPAGMIEHVLASFTQG
ncbi:tripartite tricarboxylate transporter TctB family protein [Chelatococcus sp.]|nr:tripartite tricarboxylate transporter TctB family protein [Chelatococcus sp.]MBX3542172.1 tripartite tricarboxylate transporter TctB family protein [Chelatococcus sp.]MCO5075612.1 tripartite tricarboxylate transporter TctB family protein [Chelatococcus sp.]CAH1655006.1 membrane hypothetical protein [Hyphomicrobiales bacterium]CAH1695207.1 membrane hypothetical protein [Hyphomicrobiales bacterium]